MVAICRALYNGRYPMGAEPIKTLEFHYPMIQFLIFVIHLPVVSCTSFQQEIHRHF